MAYKDDTTVISVPLSRKHNQKLINIADKNNAKSKTSYAKKLLEEAIDKEYGQIDEEDDVNDKNGEGGSNS